MLEVSIHKDADRKAVVDALKKFGPVTERMLVAHLVGVETDLENVDQIRSISGVVSVEDGEQLSGGFEQTHVITEPLAQNTSSYMLALQALNFEPQRILHDLLYADTTITRSGANDGSGVVIGIADNLVSNSGHSEFTGRFDGTTVYNGYPSDAIHPHGNWVASAAAGASYGVAPGATLINARGLRADNLGTTTNLVNAMDAIGAAHDNGSAQHICNCSFGGTDTSYNTVVLDLADSGVPVICAVGNSGLDLGSTTVLPAESPDAFAVGGHTLSKLQDANSNFGDPVDVWAGYGPHWLIDETGTFGQRNGTSFAAPIVCGVAALMLQGRDKMTTLAEVRSFYAELRKMTKRDLATTGGVPNSRLRRINYPLAANQFSISRG